MKFHLTAQGPRPCSATQRACPLGGEHYPTPEAAQAAYERERGASLLPQARAASGKFQAVPQPMGRGGSYVGCEVPQRAVEAALERFRQLLGGPEAHALEEAKAQRDGGYLYHMTVVDPRELRALRKTGGTLPEVPEGGFPVAVLGLGTASEGEAQAWYAVCSSPEAAAWRAAAGLPPKDFHVTLAFRERDVHSLPKGESTLLEG